MKKPSLLTPEQARAIIQLAEDCCVLESWKFERKVGELTVTGDQPPLYRMVRPLRNGEPVQYLGVYALRWRPEWGPPQVGFVEAKEEDDHADA